MEDKDLVRTAMWHFLVQLIAVGTGSWLFCKVLEIPIHGVPFLITTFIISFVTFMVSPSPKL